MNYFLGVSFILISWHIISRFLKKRNLKKFKNHLIKNWGVYNRKKHFNFFVIGKYFENNAHKEKAYHLITETTKTDLDIDEVFKFIDRTSSKIGQQYLYYKLRTIQTLENLLKFDSLSSTFLKE